jgi:hypothetical protein
VRRYAHCPSAGTGAEVSQIRIQGASHTTLPHNKEDIDLSSDEINLDPIRNELGFDLYSTCNTMYTIFIERQAATLFSLGDLALHMAAKDLWKYFLLQSEILLFTVPV